MSSRKRALVGVVLTTMLLAGLPAGAQAQSEGSPAQSAVAEEDRGDRLERAKQRIARQIERRLRTVDRLTTKVTSSRVIADEHETALLRDYGAASDILTAGLGTVAAADTLEELRETAPPIFETTLVYALLSPKTHAVIGSGTTVAVADRATRVADRLEMALDRIAETGVDVSDAQTKLNEAAELIATAEATGGPVADEVIGLQPGDDYRQPLADAKAALRTSRELLGDARALMKDVIQFVRGVVGGEGS